MTISISKDLPEHCIMSTSNVNGSSTEQVSSTGIMKDEAKDELFWELLESTATLVFPGDKHYDQYIKRWSDTCEKRAVSA